MKRIFSAVMIICVSAMLSGCRSEYQWNQKLTVTVETPQGERSGSAVVHETVLYGQLPMSGNDVEPGIKGEATIVEVAPGKFLFALLNSGGNGVPTWELFYHVWHDDIPDGREDGLKFIQSKRETRNVPPDAYPLLVTFTDINDPKSVLEVKPNDIAATFGSGYSLKSITLEITNELATEGKVEKVLGWIGEYYDKQFDENTIETIKASNRLANSLASGNFITGRK